jgi:hypothetical protein
MLRRRKGDGVWDGFAAEVLAARERYIQLLAPGRYWERDCGAVTNRL